MPSITTFSLAFSLQLSLVIAAVPTPPSAYLVVFCSGAALASAGTDCNDNGIPDALEPDTDLDSIIDECDNCPNDPNVNQDDADVDGVGDVCDQCPTSPSGAQVDQDGCAPVHNVSQDTHYGLIQWAMDVANSNDLIEVSPGTFQEALNFEGKTIVVRSTDGPETTIIDATGLDTSVVIFANGEDPDTVLEGFTITGGTGSFDPLPVVMGGGVLISESSPTIIDCIISGNVAAEGGGMFIDGNPSISNCQFLENTAIETTQGRGGAVNATGSPTFANCTFWRNTASTATAPGAGAGGAIYTPGNATQIVNCTFSQNTSLEGGNDVFGDPTITNSVLWSPAPITGSPTVTFSDIRGGYPGMENIDLDPLFVDSLNGDLRMSPDSPCIDAGINKTTVPALTDLDGNPRIYLNRIDIGAFELRDCDANGVIDDNQPDEDLDGYIDACDSCPQWPNDSQHYPRFDVDSDCDVDGVDFAAFASCFNKAGNPPRSAGCPPVNKAEFDFDLDGDVDGVDFAEFSSCFNKAGNPSRCVDQAACFIVFDAADLTAAIAQAKSGDTIKTVVPRIDMPAFYAVPPDVTLTSDGTRENRIIAGSLVYLPSGPVQPIHTTVRNITIGGRVLLYDPFNVLVEDCYIDGDIDDTGNRLPSNAFWMLVQDRPVCLATARRCEPRNLQLDGFSLSWASGGSQVDASGGTLVVEDCYVDGDSNMGTGLSDQPLTTHSRGRLIVKGGRYGPTPARGMAVSGSPYSPIELYDATFVGGYIEANIVERCRVIDGGAILHNWTGEGHMYDTVFENSPAINVWDPGEFEIKRSLIRAEDWNSPAPSSSTGLNIKSGASVAIESSILIGNHRTSSGASRAVVGGGTDDPSRSIAVTNCLFHNWGFVFNVHSDRFYNCELTNNILLGNVNLVTALSPSITTGAANYHDGVGHPYIPDATKFPNGDGAAAYDVFDYDNDDFHPIGPDNYIKARGVPHNTPVYDLDGNLFDQFTPDLGPYRVPNN